MDTLNVEKARISQEHATALADGHAATARADQLDDSLASLQAEVGLHVLGCAPLQRAWTYGDEKAWRYSLNHKDVGHKKVAWDINPFVGTLHLLVKFVVWFPFTK